jgi:hypothetical protein
MDKNKYWQSHTTNDLRGSCKRKALAPKVSNFCNCGVKILLPCASHCHHGGVMTTGDQLSG